MKVERVKIEVDDTTLTGTTLVEENGKTKIMLDDPYERSLTKWVDNDNISKLLEVKYCYDKN